MSIENILSQVEIEMKISTLEGQYSKIIVKLNEIIELVNKLCKK